MAADQLALPLAHLESQVHIVDGQLQAVQHDAAQLPAQRPQTPAVCLAAAGGGAAAHGLAKACASRPVAACCGVCLRLLLHLQR